MKKSEKKLTNTILTRDSLPVFIRNREELESFIISKKSEGHSIRSMAKHYKINRYSIRKILRKHEKQREEGHNILNNEKKQIVRSSKLDPYIPIIKTLMEKYPNITGQRVYEELKESGYTGKITILRDRLKLLRPKPKKNPIVRFETEPGHQGQMDWSPYTIKFSRLGKVKVQCFSYILGFSRRHYIHFSLRRDFYTLIRRHQDAFNYFQGVPSQCLYDGEKTILLRWEAGRPVYNPSFIAFITHYNCKPFMCRPRTPQTKGKIEAPFQYVEKNLLNGREFQDLEDLNAKGKWWMKERSDVHIHDTTGQPPIELFIDSELKALNELPIHPYDSSEVSHRIGGFDGFIEFETNTYSIPYEYGGEILAFKASEKEISVYSPELKLIANHERLPAGACRPIENPDHRGSKKVRYGLESVKDTFLALGDIADSYLKGLKDKYPRNCGFHVRYILRLKEKYNCDDITKALYHAIRYHAYDGKTIERILLAKAKPRTLESIRNEKARNILEKSLPKIKQRSLLEYGELFINRKEVTKNEQKSESRGGENNSDKKTSENSETDKTGASS